MALPSLALQMPAGLSTCRCFAVVGHDDQVQRTESVPLPFGRSPHKSGLPGKCSTRPPRPAGRASVTCCELPGQTLPAAHETLCAKCPAPPPCFGLPPPEHACDTGEMQPGGKSRCAVWARRTAVAPQPALPSPLLADSQACVLCRYTVSTIPVPAVDEYSLFCAPDPAGKVNAAAGERCSFHSPHAVDLRGLLVRRP